MLRLNRHHIFLTGLITGLLFVGIHILNFHQRSDFATGTITGWEGSMRTSYPIVTFKLDHKSYTFLAESNLELAGGQAVEVIYDINNPNNAAIYTFTGFYMRYFFYLIIPLLLFGAFVYSWFEKEDYIILNFKKNQEPRIQKSRRLH